MLLGVSSQATPRQLKVCHYTPLHRPAWQLSKRVAADITNYIKTTGFS